MSSTESNNAVKEFVTFVVDVRARHLSSGSQSEDIPDVIAYLLASSSGNPNTGHKNPKN